ncbi:Variant Ionotropic Glutamate Receptor [Penaeus vannamei]|uniref:Variant Ionotropic Glutamate Receptor n=1 Tax=Penaeus vannamei TaxID=6689 RepID=A0A423TVV5_PENVA|nr:Variant Ionotropic Glutamate Receptor [Penaeus vannamei]
MVIRPLPSSSLTVVQKVRVAALRDLVSAERYANSTCCLFLAVVESTSLNPVAGVGDLPGNHTLQRPSYHTFLTTKEEGVAEKTRETRALRSLRALLVTIVKQELSDCALVLAADQGFLDSRVLANLLRLPNLRQVVAVATAEDFYGLLWEASQCLGFVFLLQDPTPFLEFVNTKEDPWAFGGKHVIVGATRNQLEVIANSKKGRKTEHMIGLVQVRSQEPVVLGRSSVPFERSVSHINTKGYWQIYMNLLFWGPGVAVVNRWHPRGFFTRASDLFPDKVIAFEYAPHVFYVKNSTEKYGRDVEVMAALAKVLNFSIVFQEPPSGELWGKRLPNGTWDGLVGMMARNEAYMGLVNSFISDNNDRLDEIDGTPPPPRGESFRRLDDSFLCAWGIQLREPQTFFPSCTSTRILLASMWLSSVILTIAYSSHLTAFLTIARRPPVLQTFKELYEANIEVASIGEFFNVSMAATGNYYLQECFAPHSIGVALQRHTPLRRSLDRALEWMVESGLVTHWFSQALSRQRKSTNVDSDQTASNERDYVTALNLDHMQGIFLILTFGHLASCAVFAVELLRGKMRAKRQ